MTSAKPVDLSRFCGTCDIRDYLNAPWRDHGRLYASNGHFAIELVDDGREAAARGEHPDVLTLLEKYSAATEWQALPKLPPRTVCEQCHGKGAYRLIACDDCEGRGEFEHGRFEYDCKACDGTGQIGDPDKDTRCDNCGGLGEPFSSPQRVGFELNGYSARYLRVVSELPGVLVAETGKDQPLAFKFDGGRGLVMPMRKD